MYIDANYSRLNKFSRANNRNFVLLLPKLQRIVKGSALVVAG
jgi:hypothetical protein